MNRTLKNMYGSLELLRYKLLAKNSLGAFMFRGVIYLLYPILGSRLALTSKWINYRNRERNTLYSMIQEASHRCKKTKKDMVLCYYYYHIVPWEYKLYQFENQSHKDRLKWLSDTDRYMCCDLIMGDDIYRTLKDKSRFYQMLKQYYKRPIFTFSNLTSEIEFRLFIDSVPNNLFVKPLDGSLGRDTFLVSTKEEKETLFLKLKETKTSWLIEGQIKQVSKIAAWNNSSVNTLRIPSFRDGNQWHILQPFFRTGRYGQIVDNAGAGGIICTVDSDSGKILTDGFVERSNRYEFHPDSHMHFKDWEIPNWKELTELTRKIHQSLPDSFKYIGFDFALTEAGWDLIEGNWGQFVGQIAAQKGIKQQFDNYLGIQ